MNNLRDKTKKAFVWDYLSTFLNYFLNFSVTLFLARLLSPEDYGNFAIITAIGALSSLLMDTGLSSALVQRKEVDEGHFQTVFLFNLYLGIVLFILFYALSPVLADFYSKPLLSDLMKVYSVVFIISSFGIIRRTKLRKELKFKTMAQINIVSIFISGIIAIILAYMGFGIWSLIIQTLLNILISNILLFINVRIKTEFIFKIKFSNLKYLWSFGFSMFLASLINKVVLSFESLILGKLFTIETLGYFNRAQSFNNFIIINTSSSINNVFFPAISKIQDDNDKIKEMIFKVLHILCFAVFFLLGFIYLVSDDLIIILLTKKWIFTSDILKILLLSGFTYPISAFLINILSAKGYSKKFLIMEILRKSIFIINFGVGFIFGFYYYLIGFTGVGILSLLINIFFVSKVTDLRSIWYIKIIVKYLVISLLFVIFLHYLLIWFEYNNYLHFFLSLISYSILYLFANYLFKLKGLFEFIYETKSFVSKFKLNI